MSLSWVCRYAGHSNSGFSGPHSRTMQRCFHQLGTLPEEKGFQPPLPLGRPERGLTAAPAMPGAAQMLHWGLLPGEAGWASRENLSRTISQLSTSQFHFSLRSLWPPREEIFPETVVRAEEADTLHFWGLCGLPKNVWVCFVIHWIPDSQQVSLQSAGNLG